MMETVQIILFCAFLVFGFGAICLLAYFSDRGVPSSLTVLRKTAITKALLENEAVFARENVSIKWWAGIIPNENFGLAKSLGEAFGDAGWQVDHWRQRMDEKYLKGVWVSGREADRMLEVLKAGKIKARKREIEGDDIVIVCGE